MHVVVALKLEALVKQNGRCAYCKDLLPSRDVTADHRHPRCFGGRNEPRNIAATCRPCNIAKGNMTEGQFYRLVDAKRLPPGAPIEILLIWASRRIYKRTKRAVERIERKCGLERRNPCRPGPTLSTSVGLAR